MSNSFRIDESELRTWHSVLAARLQVRGVAALAKEIEAHLAKKDADGSVVVSRHQLFTWAEALQGAAARDGSGALPAVVADMRAILGGKPAGAAASPAAAAPLSYSVDLPPQGMYFPPQRIEVTQSPPPVQYASSASSGGAAGRLVAGRELGDLARDLVRSARSDLLVSTPWDTGLDSLVQEIIALPPTVAVRIVSRRPAQDPPAFHQALDQLGRRRAVTAFSNFIQTRCIVQDQERALIGAASIPTHVSREAAWLLTDRAAVAAVRAHVEAMHAEAAGPVK